MRARRILIFASLACLLIFAGVVALSFREPAKPTPAPRSRAASTRMPPRSGSFEGPAKKERAGLPADAISPIANELNAPGGSIRRDLEILNEVFAAWQTNFPRQGNPVGENEEITAALTGDNPLHFGFVAPTHPAINAKGQLCDRWGTPFRFHQLSGTEMEIQSAGPDRRFATEDDVHFAPSGNPP